jgi:two-component system, chemotaxis family, response regulator Rcp1
MMARPTLNVLLIDDNPGDVRLTQEVFKDSKISNNLSVVMDGMDVMEYLRREGRFAQAVRPDLILLDLNLPRKNGREVLAEIKADANLRRIPVLVLTVSQAEEDVIKAYDLHANCYVTKPLNLDQFMTVVRSIEDFWFTIVKLPPQGEP